MDQLRRAGRPRNPSQSPTDWGSQIGNYRLGITDWELQIGNYRLGITWAHIAIIPTNNPIDAKAAASSTKTLNITASLTKNVQGT